MSDSQSWTTATAEVQDDDVIVRGRRLSDDAAAGGLGQP
jgi:hypothetical protein